MVFHKARFTVITALVIVSLLLVNLPVAAGSGTTSRPANQAVNSFQQPLAPTVTATVGGGGAYATLKEAFDDINSGVLTGTVQLDVIGDTTETATAVLNASGVLTASYTSVLIQPVGGSWTISGTLSAGPLIDFNGADNITVDGLNTGGNALTIVNWSTASASGTSTIRFIGGATNNTITNATILGAFSAAVGTNGGNIYFATDGVSGNGNDNNTISNNKIGPLNATTLPTKGIYSNGSTTTTAVNNSGNVVTGNEIYDYFGAAVSSAGVYIAGGSTDFTISNNKFYQTTTRTQTTGAQHSGIWIANASGNNFQITGNTIGYASNSGTGMYTFVGVSSSSVLIPIYLSVGTTTATSVQGNTVAGMAMSGAVSGVGSLAAFRGIYVSSGLTTVGDVTGNVIGSQTNTNSIVFTSTSTASTSDVIGIYNYGSSNWTVSNNTIGGIYAVNTSTAAANIYGIRVNTSSSASFTCQNNTIGGDVANSIQSVSTATGTTVQGIRNESPAGTITGNLIRNLTAAGGTGTTTSASVMGIAVVAASANHTVRQNTIHSLSNTNALAATTVSGIQYNGATGTNLVARNLLHSFNVASPAGIVNGISVSGGTTTYQNNMIRLGIDAAGNAITAGAAFNGVSEASGTNNFYFNSVYVGGTDVVSTTSNSYAFNSTVTTNVRNFRNNLFVNARSNASLGGKHYGIRVGGTTANPTGLTSNNNVITATGTGAGFGFFNSADVADLAAWRTVTGQDAASFDLDPQFIAPAAATPDLHISTTITTAVEANGFPIAAVTDDYDGEVRANYTPTDIGADAGNFIGMDLASPAITYTPFGNTSLTGDRVLTANLSDATGVPTSGSQQPRIYYNKNSGAWYSSQGALVSGSGVNGTWNFTVTVADVGGVTAGDVISYFVIAEDTANPINLASNPAGVVAIDVNNMTTAPTPRTYTIVPAIGGTYDVGATEVYTSLTNVGGLFEAINAGALTGNIIVNITSDLVGESGTVALNQWSEDGVGGYTLLIRPSGAARIISGTGVNSTVIKLNGADRVTLDGSLSGGTDRSLTIVNPNTASGTSALWVGSLGAGAGATNNTIKNTIIQAGTVGSSSTTAVFGVFVGDTTGAANGADNDNLTIQNNEIRRASYGIQAVGGATAGQQIDNLVIAGNLIGDSVITNSIRTYGLLVGQTVGASIADNVISNVVITDTGNPYGIVLSTGVLSSSVTANDIADVRYTGTGGYGGKGIDINTGSAASNLTIANNMVSNIRGDSWSSLTGDSIVGIRVSGTTGGVRLYFNSVNLGSGTFAGNSSGTASAAMYFASTATNLDVRNNILSTNLVNSAAATAKTYAIATDATNNTLFTAIDHNLYYSSGSQGFVGLLNAVDRATLAAWQTASGQDANSLFGDPLFTSATNLHLQNASPAIWAGTPIAGITTDIDGDTRCVNAPSIGADEGQLVPAATFTFDPTSPLINQPVDFTATVLTGTAPFTHTWDFGDGSPIGSGNPVSHTYAVVGTYDVTLTVECQCGVAVHTAPVTVSDAATPPSLGPLQSSSPTALGDVTYFTSTLLAGSTPITYTWDFGDGAIVEDGLLINHTYTQTGQYEVSLTAENAAGTDTVTTTVEVGVAPTASFSFADPTTYPDPTAFTFTGEPGTPPTTYLWTFGDGFTSTIASPTHSYTAPQPVSLYTVTLTVQNNYGVAVTGTVVTVLNTSADLGIVKADSPDPLAAGQPLSYTLVVSNFGPNTLIGAPVAVYPFTNTTYITIPASGAGTPYPSAINVSGITDVVGKVRVTLYGLSHTFANDIDVLLVGPGGQSVILMSDVGGTSAVSNVTMTFDDDATASVPASSFPSGTYNPSNSGTGDTFPAPALAGPYGSTLGGFVGVDPNGDWNLFVVDDASPDSGSIIGGWSLELTTVAPVTTTVIDTLPNGYTYGGATGSGWSCAGSAGTVTCTRGLLLLGAAPNIVITGNAPALTVSGEITNTATVASELPDFNSINNTATITTFVNALTAQLTVNYVGNGTVSQAPMPPYNVGDVVTLTANAATGWSFAGWGGDLTGTSNPATITLTGNNVVTATFAINTYIITPTAGANGSITPNTPQTVDYGASQMFTIAANTGYHISDVGVDGLSIGVMSAYTFTNITADHTITAAFTANSVNLTMNVVGNGTVTSVPASPYLYGDVVTLTATADPNWSFAGWSGDLSGTTNPAALTLTGNHVVTATFVLDCVPVAGVDFTYTPMAPKVGQLVTFNGSVLTGTAPITYSWNFGDSSPLGSGSPIAHLFPLSPSAQSYTVTLTAENACGTLPVSKSLQVQLLTVFLPLIRR